MIKIGRSYFNESQIAAIHPNPPGGHVDVYLAQGTVIAEQLWEDDLQEVLERAGMLQHVDDSLGALEFTDSELDTLRQAWEDEYLFAAKDQNGQVFAYRLLPGKTSACWDDSGTGQPRRLIGDFDALSFEDDVPLDLNALFSGDPAEGFEDV